MNPAQRVLIVAIRLYRWFISPAKLFLFGHLARCRFTPSCSEYAMQAVRTHGAFFGGWFAVKRLLRCHPWGGCGEDYVPPATLDERSAAVPAAAASIVGAGSKLTGCGVANGPAAAGTAALRC
jgi:putative membrane protein insertion efficiency factor